MEHSSAIKVTIDTSSKWMNLKSITLNKRSQTPKPTCHVIPFTGNYSTGKTAELKKQIGIWQGAERENWLQTCTEEFCRMMKMFMIVVIVHDGIRLRKLIRLCT